MEEILKIIENEPNFLEWTYNTKSGQKINCRIVRHNDLKHLCGYVFLDESNDLYGKDYFDIDVDVHGGLTFSGEFEGGWLIGFDCGHYEDLVPGISFVGTYRDINYVKSECENLAEQVSKYTKV